MKQRIMKWLPGGICILLLGLIILWWFVGDRPPSTPTIATAQSGGQYYRAGTEISKGLKERLKLRPKVLSTQGTVENIQLLKDGKVDLAIVQDGVPRGDDISVLVPLFQDVVMVIVRSSLTVGGNTVTDVHQLQGLKIACGHSKSGMYHSAARLLDYYGVKVLQESKHAYFASLMKDESFDGAIVTTGLLNPDLVKLMGSGKFKILPLAESRALQEVNGHWKEFKIPRGIFGGHPVMPPTPVQSIATTSLLVAPKDSSKLLVYGCLDSLYQSDFQVKVPVIIPRTQAKAWDGGHRHPAALSYFQPYGGLDVLGKFLEWLSALKEVLFACVAIIYLLWERMRKLKLREREKEFRVLKERLDHFLDQTVDVERTQMGEKDPIILETYLNKVTEIKLEAINELTHEDLRADQQFSIFLTQCANLIRKLQTKIQTYQA